MTVYMRSYTRHVPKWSRGDKWAYCAEEYTFQEIISRWDVRIIYYYYYIMSCFTLVLYQVLWLYFTPFIVRLSLTGMGVQYDTFLIQSRSIIVSSSVFDSVIWHVIQQRRFSDTVWSNLTPDAINTWLYN